MPVRARVDAIHGLSAHADANGLLRWLRTAIGRPRHVFVVHGEPAPAEVLAGRIRTEIGWDVSVPDYREARRPRLTARDPASGPAGPDPRSYSPKNQRRSIGGL